MTFELICWPDIQMYMEYPGFSKNACLANSTYFIDTYGSSAYFVNSEWARKTERKFFEEMEADDFVDEYKNPH